MRPDDFPRFRAVLVGLAKVYERELDGPLLDAYWLALRDWALDDFERASGYLLSTSEFMPRPAAFAALRRAGEMSAGEAWSAAVEHARGAYRAGPAVPPVERAVRSIGGWGVLARATEESLPFLERRFAEHYAELVSREEVRVALPAIVDAASTWRRRALGPSSAAELLALAKLPPGNA